MQMQMQMERPLVRREQRPLKPVLPPMANQQARCLWGL